MTTTMIEAIEVGKTFGTVTALDGVSIQVPRGSVLGLLGHNGAGKTTLVNLLTTAFPPTSGTARVCGLDVVDQAQDVRRRIGLTGQFASVDEDLTGAENLRLIARLLGATRTEAAHRATELLELFDLHDAAHRAASGYSGGMRRRLDLAASLVGHPEVIFLDEPTTGLDPTSRIGLWELVEKLVAEGTTILLTTQDLDEADRLADSITLLSQGKVVAAGSAAELKADIGQHAITVTIDPSTPAASVADAIRRAGLHPSFDSAGRTVSIPVAASTAMVTVVRALDEAGIEPVALALSEPTLDDVYLAFTRPLATTAA